jgi:predicted transcriptional regulator
VPAQGTVPSRGRPTQADISLHNRSAAAYVHPMTHPAPVADHVETEAERKARLAWEAAGIAEARADVAAGRLVDAAEVDAWIDSIGTDHELPVPRARH